MRTRNTKNIRQHSVANFQILVETIRDRLSEERYLHSRGVATLSLSLAIQYGHPCLPGVIAGLLHDIAKEIPNECLQEMNKDLSLFHDDYIIEHPGLWHAPASRWLAQYIFEIADVDILQAIEIHPTGKPEMNPVEKILFVADYCEPYRKEFDPSKIRKIAFKDLDKATYFVLTEKHRMLYAQNIQPHPQSEEALQYYKKITGVK